MYAMVGRREQLRRGRTARICTQLAAVAGVALVTGGCSVAVSGAPVADRKASAQQLDWDPCQSAGSSGGAQLPADAQCAVLTVPVDYAQPGQGSASLALIRFPASGKKLGSLVINPGGPGESGVDAASGLLASLPPQVRQHFDLVGFDPRGVGASSPAVHCNSDKDEDAERADPQVDYSSAGVAHIEDTEKQYVQRCLDKTGKAFLANVGTASVVQDLDALRAALGDNKLTYLGYSYGTFIGTAYAEKYPDRVRAMVLDGAVNPQTDPVQSNIDQAAAFQKAFNDYAAECAKDPGCPLGTDPAKAVAIYQGLVDPLVGKPVPTADPRGLGYSDAITATQMALYTPTLWSDLTKGLTELAHGQGDTLLKLADAYLDRDDQGHYSNANDALAAINCVDQPRVTDRATAIDEDRRLRQAAPFLSYGTFTGDAPMDACAFWPVPPTSTPHPASAKGLAPVLVVSTTDDPATPYQAGVDLAKQLGAGLLSYQGTQHTVVFQGDACVDGYATAYLVGLTLPPPGAKC
jgi:pimeloyl-ACP methyl ester carboxylesterase